MSKSNVSDESKRDAVRQIMQAISVSSTGRKPYTRLPLSTLTEKSRRVGGRLAAHCASKGPLL